MDMIYTYVYHFSCVNVLLICQFIWFKIKKFKFFSSKERYNLTHIIVYVTVYIVISLNTKMSVIILAGLIGGSGGDDKTIIILKNISLKNCKVRETS